MASFLRRKSHIIKNYEEFLEEGKAEFVVRFEEQKTWKLSPDDLEFIKLIGVGSMGRVFLARHQTSSRVFAVKVVRKDVSLWRRQTKVVRNEKAVLQAVHHPFLVYLEFAFQDSFNVYLGLPFLAGGELFGHLRRTKKFDEAWSRFYCGQVLLALEYLHHCGVIYRDLKPENVLLDGHGYLRLTDLGTCKIGNGKTYTFCGTPDYVAPEIVLSRQYNKAVDWWSLGVLLFEMSAGYTPFHARSEVKIYKKSLNGVYTLPAHFSDELKDLVRNLLQVDVTKRFGNLKDGVDDIKTHSWFSSIDWLQLINKKITPPFVPDVENDGDTKNFIDYGDRTPISECQEPVDIDFEDF